MNNLELVEMYDLEQIKLAAEDVVAIYDTKSYASDELYDAIQKLAVRVKYLNG